MSKKDKINILKRLIVTDHFMERYKQRIWNNDDHKINSMSNDILVDMIHRMTEREANIFQLFSLNKCVKLPFGKVYQVVIQKNVLITIY